ncbi:FtsH protease activity modulator HflK [Desulfoplanes formicivorans]|uniref:Protein HflK n=1 Tax=Desulfoplanes formicivorans TaxID=1592317 RepID=A0A194AD63_9BACT|nr:FtsH protease activity modulator HflK [Desulfoplanes formicivorans]GAU08037.1 membrane protein [Desulfoplanes formicivorans]
MSWDWEKLQEQKQRNQPGRTPDLGNLEDKIKQIWQMKFPGMKFVVAIVVLLWLASGIYIVEPDEVGVVQRFGAYARTTPPGPHYHLPVPLESVQTPKVTQVRRIEIGFRSGGGQRGYVAGQNRSFPEEALMLTGDENIVNVQFIVQYQIKNAQDYLFNISQPQKTVKDAAEAAMRKVIGHNKIDNALTTGKFAIQNDTKQLLQTILDHYTSGINIVAVQLQDVHPPKEVSDAFKDVASAKEDKSRFINEAEAYRNDLIPKTRGEVASIVNQAEAYKQTVINKAEGDSSRFLAVLREYKKAKDITKKRLYLETMESILSQPSVQKVILSSEALGKAVPYLPLDRLGEPAPTGRMQGASNAATGNKGGN